MRNWKEFIRAEHALRAVDPDADDETLMALAADCLTAGRGPRYRPYIRHDPPCPLRHDWRGQNVVGITTTDREVARRWVIEVMRLALLWQIYSRRCCSPICFLQCGHRCGGGRTMSSMMAWRTAGRLG